MPKNETFRSIQLYNTVTYMHILGNGAKWEWKIVIIISKQRKGTNISWANYKNSKYFMYTKYGNILGTARVFKTIVYNGRLVRHFICCGDRVKYCVVEAYIAVFEHPITYIFLCFLVTLVHMPFFSSTLAFFFHFISSRYYAISAKWYLKIRFEHFCYL